MGLQVVSLIAILSYALPADPPVETVRILVARQKVPLGTLLNEPEKFFTFVRNDKGDEPKAGLPDLAPLKGKRVIRSHATDQPVKTDDLTEPVYHFAPIP